MHGFLNTLSIAVLLHLILGGMMLDWLDSFTGDFQTILKTCSNTFPTLRLLWTCIGLPWTLTKDTGNIRKKLDGLRSQFLTNPTVEERLGMIPNQFPLQAIHHLSKILHLPHLQHYIPLPIQSI